MSIIQTAEEWLFKVAAKKVIYALVKSAVALFVSSKAEGFLISQGVHVDLPALQISLPTLLYGFLEGFHDWARLKFGTKFL